MRCSPSKADPDIVCDQPFYHKWGFIGNAPDTVKHKYQQNIKLALLGVLFNQLHLVPSCRSDLMAGNAFLLKFTNQRPAHSLTKFPAPYPLHGNVRLVVVCVVKLLTCGNTI